MLCIHRNWGAIIIRSLLCRMWTISLIKLYISLLRIRVLHINIHISFCWLDGALFYFAANNYNFWRLPSYDTAHYMKGFWDGSARNDIYKCVIHVKSKTTTAFLPISAYHSDMWSGLYRIGLSYRSLILDHRHRLNPGNALLVKYEWRIKFPTIGVDVICVLTLMTHRFVIRHGLACSFT